LANSDAAGSTSPHPRRLRERTGSARAPLLILLIVGIIDFGRFTYFSIQVMSSARAAVQYGAQNSTTASDIAGTTAAGLNDGASVPGLTVTPSSALCRCSDGTASCSASSCKSPNHTVTYVSATSSATLTPLIKYPGIPASIIISKTVEQQVSP